MTNVLHENSEVERVKAYLDHGPVGRFDFDKEIKFIKSQRQLTKDIFDGGYIDEVEYQTTMMTLSGRYIRLRCYQVECFGRCPF